VGFHRHIEVIFVFTLDRIFTFMKWVCRSTVLNINKNKRNLLFILLFYQKGVCIVHTGIKIPVR
jgi:hypothetical protein